MKTIEILDISNLVQFFWVLLAIIDRNRDVLPQVAFGIDFDKKHWTLLNQYWSFI